MEDSIIDESLVKQVVKDSPDKTTSSVPYYDISPLLDKGGVLSFVVGQRGAGKTYAFKDLALRNWKERGEQFVYMRRVQDDLLSVQTLFDDICEKYDMRIEYYGGRFYEITDITLPEIGEDGSIVKQAKTERKLIGYCMLLSYSQRYKGSSYPNVTTICFDEFILEAGNQRYLKDEVNMLMSIYSTIARGRDNVKLICLSNAGFLNNPYFSAYDITGQDVFETKRFIRRNCGKVVFEFIKNNIVYTGELSGIAPQSYIEYANNNVFQDNDKTLICKIPKKSRPVFSVELEIGQLYTVYRGEDEDIFYMTDKYIKGLRESRLVKSKISLVLYDRQVIRFFKFIIEQGAMRFDTMKTKFIFDNIRIT